MSCLKRVESEETLDISGPIHEDGPGEGAGEEVRQQHLKSLFFVTFFCSLGMLL